MINSPRYAQIEFFGAVLPAPAEAQVFVAATHADLRARFLQWFNSLPEVSRNRPFAMIEIEAALHTQGCYISPVLISLGWQRKRKWNSKTQYHRYWVPDLPT